MDTAVVLLSFGMLVLICGSLALLIVRLSSPNLQGIGWLSAAFASGAMGAGLLLLRGVPPISVYGADVSLLLSFVLVHTAVLKLLRDAPGQPWHGAVLLSLQVVADLLRHSAFTGPRIRVISIGVLVAVQAGVTASVLWRFARGARAPAIFSAVILVLFAFFNLVRSAVYALESKHQVLNRNLGYAAFSLYIAVALGLSFGFFWLTNAKLTAELEHMAGTDPLTRLYNRRVFLRWCEKELLRSHRSGAIFSLLLVDLDHFKSVNDNFGHQAGDEVLCAAVEKMQDSVRGIDVLCRWGGEEFAVLLPNASLAATRVIAERMRSNIASVALPPELRASPQATGFRVTASIGMASYRDAEDTISSLLERADVALYRAKQGGRDRVLEMA